jgi:hypothetical protein
MSALSYETVVEELLVAVPAFRRTSSEWDADLPHEVLGAFALHLCESIRTGGQAELVVPGFQFLDRMADAQDQDVVNLLVVSVLEIVADDPLCKQACREATTDKVRGLLERVSQGWPPAH